MTTGVLPYRTFKDNVLWNTGFFECSSTDLYTQQGTSSGNHDTAGMSMGNLQYNFGAANRLNELWNHMLDYHEQDCIDAFGTNTAEYQTWKTAVRSTVQQDKIDFGASITDPNNSHAVIEPYKSIFRVLGNNANHVQKYKDMADLYYFAPVETVFNQMSCTSRLAYASLFDTYINKGRYYPINMLQADFDKIDADTTIDAVEKERQKIYQINYRGNYDNAVRPTLVSGETQTPQSVFWDGDNTAGGRRGCMANQAGTYYGLVYDPDVQFDMNQEPATDNKAPSTGGILGSTDILAVYKGTTKISNMYFGATKLGSGITQTTSSVVPKTQFRTNAGSYAGLSAGTTAISLASGAPLWVDVQEPFVACRTYYTLDGSNPTTASAVYDRAFTFDSSVTLKTLTVSLSGVAEAVKTLQITVATAPTTTISPSATVQNSIPLTITLTSSEAGATIYYKIGSNTTQNVYSGPFQVTQSTSGVNGTSIPITYWSVGASATETAKTITYDTSGAVPSAPVLTATAGNNQVSLSWTNATNVTSYTIYRSTTAGDLGAWIGTTQYYGTGTTSYLDTNVTAGTIYYYTIYANNYATFTPSTQKSATPTATPTKASWRYLRILGYGAGTGTDLTTRVIEFEVMSGGTNIMSTSVTATKILAYDTWNNTTAPTGGIDSIRNGTKTTTSNTYPFWWTAVPNAHVVIDFGSAKVIDSMSYYSYSVSGDQRINKFIIQASNTNNGTDWTNIWDNSTGQLGLQPLLPSGYTITF